MKVTVEPETEAEKAETQGGTYVGLASVAVIGVTYEGDVLRRPYRYSFGNLEDLMREFFPMVFDMNRAIEREAPWEGVHVHGEPSPAPVMKHPGDLEAPFHADRRHDQQHQ